MALCSLVRVCTIESINSSLVRSRGIDGDFSRICLSIKRRKRATYLCNLSFTGNQLTDTFVSKALTPCGRVLCEKWVFANYAC